MHQIKTAALAGVDGLAVRVEVDVSRGLPGFHLVGLPNAEVRESRDRVMAALRNTGLKLPAGRITVNLAPAGIRKEGAAFDLAIAMGIVTHGRRGGRPTAANALYLGELSLFGELRPVRGLLAMVLAAARRGDTTVVVPAAQAWEARLAPEVEVVGAKTLAQVIGWWSGRAAPPGEPGPAPVDDRPTPVDLGADLSGQPLLCKAAVLAAVGRLNLLMVGAPGTGKTRLARLLGKLQPPLSRTEALEITRIHSAAGCLSQPGLVTRRPFRAPHHTITRAGLVGGGAGLRPGEVTLAHRGLLFLDELAEFSPAVLDVLREPLADGSVGLARGGGFRRYPAAFQLVAAMNPCRCGFHGHGSRACACTPGVRARYLARLSGPLLDRFDLFVEVNDWDGAFLTRTAGAHAKVDGWRGGHLGSGKGPRPGQAPTVDPEARQLLDRVRQETGLSLRGVGRSLRVAQVIAALDGDPSVTRGHILEALEFRRETLPALSP